MHVDLCLVDTLLDLVARLRQGVLRIGSSCRDVLFERIELLVEIHESFSLHELLGKAQSSLELTNPIRHGERTNQQDAREKSADVGPVRHAARLRIGAEPSQSIDELQQEPDANEDPGINLRWEEQKPDWKHCANATGWIQH